MWQACWNEQKLSDSMESSPMWPEGEIVRFFCPHYK